MKLIKIMLFISFTSSNCFALELDQFKNKLRSPMQKILGQDFTETLIGKEIKKSVFSLPVIPKIEKNATDSSIYNKNASIYNQGKKYNDLSLEKKRVFRISFIKELFTATRNTPVKDDELVTYLNVIEQGGSREGVYRRIVNDEVYRRLEEFPEAPKDKLINFVANYGQKYLAVTYSAEGMKKVNLYTIKKIITEKTLDVLDALAKNSEDVYKWYAVFSEEIATKYPTIFSGKVRTNNEAQFHYNWSKEVPFQHIKSEVIVKVHKVLNSLNN